MIELSHISKTALFNKLKEVRRAFGYCRGGLTFEYSPRPTDGSNWDGQLWMIDDLFDVLEEDNLGLGIHIYTAQTPSTQDFLNIIDVIFIDNILDLFNKEWYVEREVEELKGGHGTLVHKKLKFK